MGCGKAFYHWSIIACIKAMNLRWINMRQHTPTERQMCVHACTACTYTPCVCSTFPAYYLCERMAESRGFFPLPASLSLFLRMCVCCISMPPHAHTRLLSPHLPSLVPPLSWYIPSSLFRPPCLSARWGSQKEHLANTDVVLLFSLSHTPSLAPHSPPPLPPPVDSLFREALTRMANKAFSGRRKEEEEEEEEVPPTTTTTTHSLPSSLPSLLSSPFTRQEVLFRPGAACTCPSEPVTPHFFFFFSLSAHI